MKKSIRFFLMLFVFGSASFCNFKPKMTAPAANQSSWTVILYASIDNIQFGSFPTDLWGMTDNLLAGLGTITKPKVPVIILYDGTKKGDSRILALHLRRPIDDQGEVIGENGEVNYGDPETMARFIIWTAQHFPAQHYLLGLCHHYGWKGYNTDENSPGPLGMDILTLPEHALALEMVREKGVVLDVIWFEACSITMLETLYQYSRDARFVVGNEDTIDFYEEFNRPIRALRAISKNPGMTPEEVAIMMVDKTPLFTPSLVSNQFLPYSFALNPKSPGDRPELKRMGDLWQPTQFAFSSQGVMEVKLALDQLCQYLLDNLNGLYPRIQKARKNAKEYTLYPWYVDLWDFADLLEKSSQDQKLKILCLNLKQKINGSLVAQKKPRSAKHYHGILIMFPIDRKEFERETINQFADNNSYFDLQFSKEGLWDDFLKAYFSN